MKEYFDTPLLVFACANKGELGDRARKLIADCTSPMTTPHALAECFNSLTYRLGFPPKQSQQLIQQNTRRFRFVAMEAGDYAAAIERVVSNGLTGDKIYDALHVGAAEKGEAVRIHTSNLRDFDALKATIRVEKIGTLKPPR